MTQDHGNNAIFRRGIRFTARFIDFRGGLAGALIMGALVGYINRAFGVWPATTAALKQAAYTFLFGGLLIKLLYFLSGKMNGKITGVIVSSLIVTVITVILVFAVHSMKGTPRPLESTLPTLFLAPPGFAYLAWKHT